METTMVELKVQKIGDSLGVILPDDVVQHLNSAEGKCLLLFEVPGHEYRLTSAESHHEKIMAAAKDIMKRYDGALRELAK